jgi:hypothetical protein
MMTEEDWMQMLSNAFRHSPIRRHGHSMSRLDLINLLQPSQNQHGDDRIFGYCNDRLVLVEEQTGKRLSKLKHHKQDPRNVTSVVVRLLERKYTFL